MEKAFATCHFSIILISLSVRVVPISDFLAHASILQPYPVNNVSNGKESMPEHHFYLAQILQRLERFDIDNTKCLKSFVNYPGSLMWVMTYSKTAFHAVASQAAAGARLYFQASPWQWRI